MKTKSIILSVFIILCFIPLNGFTQIEAKSTGIGFRFSYWRMSNQPGQIIVSHNGKDSSVRVGGFGFWGHIYSRMNDNAYIEISLGGIAKVNEKTNNYIVEEVDVTVITPLIFGLKYDLLSPRNQTGIRPYISLGGGPYWITDVHSKQVLMECEEDVTVKSKVLRGCYAGGGFNFMLGSCFAINLDMKYHFLDFNVNNKLSGFEYAVGVSLMWGKYNIQN